MPAYLNNTTGFETGGLDEASFTAGSPSVQSTTKRTGTYALSLATSSDTYTFDFRPGSGTTTNGGSPYLVGFALRIGTLPGSTVTIAELRESSVVSATLKLTSTGDIEVFDAGGASAGTIETDMAAGTWYLLEVVWTQSDSGSIQIFRNGTSMGSVSDDFANGGVGSNIKLYGASGAGLVFDDVYTASGYTGTTDLLTSGGNTWEVIGAYQKTDGGSTDQGSALDAGTWAYASELPFSDTNGADYTGDPREGHMRTNSGTRSGPGAALDGTAKLAKFVFRAWRGGGGATTHSTRSGYYSGSADSYDTNTVSLGTAAAVYTRGQTSNIPTSSSHYFVMGMTVAGGRDMYLEEACAQLLQTVAAGTTYYQALAGTLTSAGTVVRKAKKALAGALTSAGALARKPAKALVGTLTSAGTLARKAKRALAGTLTTSGAVSAARMFYRALAGTLTGAGTVVKKSFKPLVGALTSAGTLARKAKKSLAGTLTTSGAVSAARMFYRALAGTLTSAGTVVKKSFKPLGGTLTSAGALARKAKKSLGGTLTSAGTAAALKLGGIYYQALAGALSMSGAVSRTTSKPLAGTLTSAGAVVRKTSKSLAGTLAGIGAVVKKSSVSLTGTLTTAGAITRTTLKRLEGILAPSGGIVRKIARALAGLFAPSGAVTPTSPYIGMVALTLPPRSVAVTLETRSAALTLETRTAALTLETRGLALTVLSRSTTLTLEDR